MMSSHRCLEGHRGQRLDGTELQLIGASSLVEPPWKGLGTGVGNCSGVRGRVRMPKAWFGLAEAPRQEAGGSYLAQPLGLGSEQRDMDQTYVRPEDK